MRFLDFVSTSALSESLNGDFFLAGRILHAFLAFTIAVSFTKRARLSWPIVPWKFHYGEFSKTRSPRLSSNGRRRVDWYSESCHNTGPENAFSVPVVSLLYLPIGVVIASHNADRLQSGWFVNWLIIAAMSTLFAASIHHWKSRLKAI